jgi:hypothetical protein
VCLKKQNRAQLFCSTSIQIDRLRVILTGREQPSAREVLAIARALDVDPAEIATSDRPSSSKGPTSAQG